MQFENSSTMIVQHADPSIERDTASLLCVGYGFDLCTLRLALPVEQLQHPSHGV